MPSAGQGRGGDESGYQAGLAYNEKYLPYKHVLRYDNFRVKPHIA